MLFKDFIFLQHNQNKVKSKQANVLNTKEETISNLINQLKSCKQLPQQSKKETIKIVNDQQLIQLLNTRQLNKPQILNTVKQIKVFQNEPTTKVQYTNSTVVNNQNQQIHPIVSVLPATIFTSGLTNSSIQQSLPLMATNQANQESLLTHAVFKTLLCLPI